MRAQTIFALAEEEALDRTADLDSFLAGVEQRAFRIARFAVRDEGEAMDIVQDAMIRLVKRYATRPVTEWPALFYRILQNRIRDWQRRRVVRDRVMSWLPARRDDGDAPPDPIALAPDLSGEDPLSLLERDATATTLQRAIEALPPRQQQTFLLRTWEGLNVAETATAMGCSQGSVKTHYSRAVHTLRDKLGEQWT